VLLYLNRKNNSQATTVSKQQLVSVLLITCVTDRHFTLLHYLGSQFNPLDAKGNYNATSNKNEVGTLAVDGWAVTFGTARKGLGGLGPHPVPSSLYQM